MDFFGLLLILTGAYLVDCGIVNRAPITTLTTILTNPAGARASLKTSRGTGFAPASPYSAGTSFSGVNGSATGIVNSAGVAAAIAFATAQIGKPYRLGATGPDAYDCSGLVQAAWKAGGYTLLRTSQLMAADPRLATVKQADLQPGDLVFPDLGHVQLYIGGGQVIEAPRTGLNVRQAGMYGFLTAARVPLPAAPVNPVTGQPNTVAGAP